MIKLEEELKRLGINLKELDKASIIARVKITMPVKV